MRRLTSRHCDLIAEVVRESLELKQAPIATVDRVAVARMTDRDIVIQASILGRGVAATVPRSKCAEASNVYNLFPVWRQVSADIARRLRVPSSKAREVDDSEPIPAEPRSRLERLLGLDLAQELAEAIP